MQSAAIEAFRKEEIACASLFSNGPHYLPVPNANLSHALLRRVAELFMLDVDLQALQEAGDQLSRQADSAMEERAEFRDHVRQLEAQFDQQGEALAPGEVRREAMRREEEEGSGPLNVDPQEVVRELEDFLRRRNQQQREQDETERGETPET
jgi:recombinational DNA repair ATPase RecF